MDEALAVLLLPGALEGFAHEAHARQLMSIPRVIALEPSRVRTPRFMREATIARQGARLRFPGRPRVLVLYHPAQYSLARALVSRHPEAELWYLRPDLETLAGALDAAELRNFDGLARERAHQILDAQDAVIDGEPLQARLRELGVINPRPFVPARRFSGQ